MLVSSSQRSWLVEMGLTLTRYVAFSFLVASAVVYHAFATRQQWVSELQQSIESLCILIKKSLR